jgi:hypothetical protein
MSEPVYPCAEGRCPYCGGLGLGDVKTVRLTQRIQRCNISACALYSVARNGKQFPMTTPTDPDSSPATVGRK